LLPHVWYALDKLRRIPALAPYARPGERRTFWSSGSGRDVRIRLEIVDATTVQAYDFDVQ
jgi:hypothetical protein